MLFSNRRRHTRYALVTGVQTGALPVFSLFYNPVTMEEADKLTPNFPWTKCVGSQGVTAQEQMTLAIPAIHEEVDEMLADTAPASWQAYLRVHTVDKASPYLGDAFVQENYNFYGKALREIGRAHV